MIPLCRSLLIIIIHYINATYFCLLLFLFSLKGCTIAMGLSLPCRFMAELLGAMCGRPAPLLPCRCLAHLVSLDNLRLACGCAVSPLLHHCGRASVWLHWGVRYWWRTSRRLCYAGTAGVIPPSPPLCIVGCLALCGGWGVYVAVLGPPWLLGYQDATASSIPDAPSAVRSLPGI